MIATPTFPDLAALVVDESLYIRRILRDMLGRVGIKRVQEAPDGAEALGLLGESKPDLVILDWDLAILSGEEFIRLRRSPTTSPAPTVPIILTLSKPTRYVVDRAIALGVNEIIAKPFPRRCFGPARRGHQPAASVRAGPRRRAAHAANAAPRGGSSRLIGTRSAFPIEHHPAAGPGHLHQSVCGLRADGVPFADP
jgi:two-component system chemotaxis response regulator CheY